MAAPRSAAGTVIRLLVVSLIVGAGLSLFNITPQGLLAGLGGTAEQILEVAIGLVEWAVPYVLIGAVVVVPIWAIMKLMRIARGR